MIKHVDMTTTVRKEEVCCTHRSLETGTTYRGQSGGEGNGVVCTRASIVVSMGWNRQGRVSRPRIGYFNVFIRL